MSQSGHHAALHEFFRWESQSWVGLAGNSGTDEKAYFMPLENLKSYFAANDSRKLSKILTEVFKSQYPPIDPELILRDHTAVFCILLRIGQGKYIEHFARYEELSDRRLPFDASHPPIGFPEGNDDPTFLQRFCEKQWMYCVPIFDGHMLHKHFGRQRLLPITSKEPRGMAGMADEYLIKLYGPNNKLLSAGQDIMKTLDANTFVLKSYRTKEAEGHYKQEVNGYRSVKHADSIIRFYGSYIHGEESNILLEYADKGSLEEYFQRETPPSRGVDIIRLWEGLFQLIKGLKAIHSVREGHHGVKPENIVVLSHGSDSPANWQFKFADFGLNNSKGKVLQDGEAAANEMQHASTYGAPECYMPYHLDDQKDQTGTDSTKITWAADIWSLGCIYSEAAMWIADGYKGLVDYRKQRSAESDRVLLKGGDCFHDGERVLQSVLDAHADIEDRLRRSDYITKLVLDSIVDEMLWEEDRPNAKALMRKSEVVSSKARQRLSVNSGDEFARPGSSQSRPLPLPRLQPPPTQPLPPIPQGLTPGLSSIAERQYQPNVEKWRSQVRPGSDTASVSIPHAPISSTESVPDLDREIAGSIASWQMGDNNSVASPITPFTSPHVSVQYDFSRHIPNEGRPRALRSQASYEYKKPQKPLSRGLSFASHSDNASVAPPLSEHPAYRQEAVAPSQVEDEWKVGMGPVVSAVADPKPIEEARSLARTISRASSRHSSSAYSGSTSREEVQLPQKSQKRLGGFTLFPTRSRNGSLPNPLKPEPPRPMERTFLHDEDAVPRTIPPFSNSAETVAALPETLNSSMEYISMNTCLEWKKAHKKVKKHSKVPPLPGANMLEGLKERDHVFIIDDSASMSSIWTDVKRVFEAISYVVKGLSPDGTELFFTVSYDTWRRKDTTDLCTYLEAKIPSGETNISYRLNLQLQSYKAKLYAAQGAKGKKAIVRPMSIYILTNGEWGKGPDPKLTIKEMADWLIQAKMPKGQVIVEFISFAQTGPAMGKLNDLAQTEFGVDIVDCTPWRGNVLKMLRGPLDKSLNSTRSDGSVSSRPASSANTLRSAELTRSSVVSELA